MISKKKRSSSRLNPVFVLYIALGTRSTLIAKTVMGAIFVFTAKLGLKSAKNRLFYILFKAMGGSSPPPPLATLLRVVKSKDGSTVRYVSTVCLNFCQELRYAVTVRFFGNDTSTARWYGTFQKLN